MANDKASVLTDLIVAYANTIATIGMSGPVS